MTKLIFIHTVDNMTSIEQTSMGINKETLNFTSACNVNCHCDGIAYTPVCHEDTGETFFNPCVASCKAYSKKERV